MKKMELEIKILNVDKKALLKKLEKLGAVKISHDIEKSYVYDLFGINSRFFDILAHINFYRNDNKSRNDYRLKKSYNEKDELKLETAMERLKTLFLEMDYLLTVEEKSSLCAIVGHTSLSSIIEEEDVIHIVNDRKFKKFADSFFLNRNKWMRLRQINGEARITIKHILPDNGFLQQIQETEIVVSNFEEANEFLEAIGYRYKNHFEKERIKYEFDNHEIDIDTWPEIPTYFEIEGENEDDLRRILEKLGYSLEDGVSVTANEVFKMYGKSMFMKRELIFDKEGK